MKSQLLLAATLVTLAGSQVHAQSSSLFGGRGVTASSGTMSNGVGGQGSGSGSGAGQSGFGNSGTMSGFTGSTAGSQTGFLSGAAVGSGLAGMSNSGNFVGNRNLSGGAAGQNGLTGRGGLSGGRNGLSSGGLSRTSNGQRNRGNQARGAASGAQSTPIRAVQVIAFTAPPRTGESIEASISSDIASAVSQGRIPGVSVSVDATGTAIVEGHVGTETDRRKAERLVQLEPGVRKVVNRITVSEQP